MTNNAWRNESFSYRREEVKKQDGLEVTVVTVVPDDKGEVPYLLNQSVLAGFVYDDKPCEVWHEGTRYYSNVHKFLKAGAAGLEPATD